MSDLPPILPEESPAEPPSRSWLAATWAALRLAKEAISGFSVSMAVHGIVLLIMALWAIELQSDRGGLSVSARQGTEETNELEIIDTAAELSGGSPMKLTAPPINLASHDAPGVPVELLPAAVGGMGEGAGSGTGEGLGQGDGANLETIILPGGGKAVRKGSFTVWTIPPDPGPRQDYAIIIEVDLPDELRLRRYPKRDLYGEVKGTDNFRMRIPGNNLRDRAGFLPIRNGKVQYTIGIPGAERLVKDRIKVGSKLLDESQTLELVF